MFLTWFGSLREICEERSAFMQLVKLWIVSRRTVRRRAYAAAADLRMAIQNTAIRDAGRVMALACTRKQAGPANTPTAPTRRTNPDARNRLNQGSSLLHPLPDSCLEDPPSNVKRHSRQDMVFLFTLLRRRIPFGQFSQGVRNSRFGKFLA